MTSSEVADVTTAVPEDLAARRDGPDFPEGC